MSKTAQLLVCFPSPIAADKTVLSLFFSRGQITSNNGDQTQELHLQSLLFFFFLFYLGLSCFLYERKARFQKGYFLTTTTSAPLSWSFLPIQSLSSCTQISELTMHVGQKVHPVAYRCSAVEGETHSFGGWPSFSLKILEALAVTKQSAFHAEWKSAGGSMLEQEIHSPLGLCAQRNQCSLKFVPLHVLYPTACTL